MPFIIADRVRETSTTVGTGNIALGGAVIGYQSFDAVMDTADTTYYVFADQAGGPNWEVGIGTFTAPSTLARTTIISSSNGGSIVNFTAGVKDVFISLPASKTNVDDQPNVIEVNSSTAALRITQTGTGNALLVEDSANPDSSPFVIDASGNVGVGTTTPTAPLDVNGNVAITGTSRRITGDFSNATFANRTLLQSSTGTFSDIGVVGPAAGQSASWTAYFGNDPTNTSRMRMLATSVDGRLDSATTGTGTALPMTFYTGGAERMRIDTSGNVGVGTSSPQGRLDVRGTDAFFTSASNTGLRIIPGAVTYMQVGNGSGTGDLSISPWFSGTPYFYINSSGNIGVGTSTPGTKLDIYDAASAGNPAVRIRDNVSDLRLYPSGGASYVATISNTPLIFNTNNTERMRIDTAGNVGVGGLPFDKLDVHGGATVRGALNIFSNTALLSWGTNTYGAFNLTNGTVSSALALNTNQAELRAVTNHPYVFYTNNTERMRLTASGLLGLGTSSPITKMTIADAGEAGTRYLGNGLTSAGLFVGYNSAAYIYNDSNTPMIFGTNAAERMRIDASGNVGIGTSSPNTRLTVFTGSSNSLDGVLVRGGPGANNVSLRPAMGPGSNNNIVQTGDSGIIFDGGAVDTGAFVIAPWANATSGIRIVASTGNVGIGNSAPGARLDVISASGVQIAASNGSISQRVGYCGFGSVFSGSASNNPYVLLVNDTERMRIETGGNVSVGTTSQFGRLTVRGGLAATANSNASFFTPGSAQGEVADIALYSTFTGTGDNGPRRTADITAGYSGGAWGNEYLAFNVGSSNDSYVVTSEKVRITAAGNVGIGTASPGVPLDVSSATVPQVKVARPSGIDMRLNAYYGSTDLASLTVVTNHPLAFHTNNTERMRIDAAGNVGIGTSVGGARLRVSGGGTVSAPVLGNVTNYPIFISNPDINYGLGIGTDSISGNVWLQSQRADSALAYHIGLNPAGGNVGVGTLSPANRLHVVSGDGGTISRIAGASFATRFISAPGVGAVVEATSSNEATYEPLFLGGSQIRFSSFGSERMRMDGSGNLGIGTSSPTERLHVSGRVRAEVGSGSDEAVIAEVTGYSNSPGIALRRTGTNMGKIDADYFQGMRFYVTNGSGAAATERARITTGGDFQFNSGYGSVATAFGCRAWVNFNGTGTVAIRASGNVSSITDNNTGDYTVNFTSAMPDANYSAVVSGGMSGGGAAYGSASSSVGGSITTTSSVRINTRNTGGTLTDADTVMVAIFR